jgi:hypothetical protein
MKTWLGEIEVSWRGTQGQFFERRPNVNPCGLLYERLVEIPQAAKMMQSTEVARNCPQTMLASSDRGKERSFDRRRELDVVVLHRQCTTSESLVRVVSFGCE